ncbi:MAG: hypothetical protein Q9165_003842 [Trypethelium subeluteriae]
MVKFFRYECGREVSQSKISQLNKQKGWSREQFYQESNSSNENIGTPTEKASGADVPMGDSNTAPLEHIASIVIGNASLVTEYLREEHYAQPSFSSNGPPKFPSTEPANVLAARRGLITAARQLQFLALGPTEALQWNLFFFSNKALNTATLRWLYHSDLPAAVPTHGVVSFGDVAAKLDVSQRVLIRVIRHAITNNTFPEPTPGYVTHTSLSLLLAQPGNPIRGVVGHQTEVIFPAVSRMVEAHEEYGSSDEIAIHVPFNVAFCTHLRALD